MSPTAAANTYLAAIEAALEPHRDQVAAVPMKKYMRDQFEFLGINNPTRVALVKQAVRGLPPLDNRSVASLARALWRKPEREYQYSATGIIRRHQKQLDAGFMETAEHLITTKSWWDTIDELAQNTVGLIVKRDRELSSLMDEWIDDDNFWLARTAILHQTRWKADTDTVRLFSYCERRSADTEFFIRKAIGWALREYSKTDARAVREFVREHDADLSGLSKREALKWLERRAVGS